MLGISRWPGAHGCIRFGSELMEAIMNQRCAFIPFHSISFEWILINVGGSTLTHWRIQYGCDGWMVGLLFGVTIYFVWNLIIIDQALKSTRMWVVFLEVPLDTKWRFYGQLSKLQTAPAVSSSRLYYSKISISVFISWINIRMARFLLV